MDQMDQHKVMKFLIFAAMIIFALFIGKWPVSYGVLIFFGILGIFYKDRSVKKLALRSAVFLIFEIILGLAGTAASELYHSRLGMNLLIGSWFIFFGLFVGFGIYRTARDEEFEPFLLRDIMRDEATK